MKLDAQEDTYNNSLVKWVCIPDTLFGASGFVVTLTVSLGESNKIKGRISVCQKEFKQSATFTTWTPWLLASRIRLIPPVGICVCTSTSPAICVKCRDRACSELPALLPLVRNSRLPQPVVGEQEETRPSLNRMFLGVRVQRVPLQVSILGEHKLGEKLHRGTPG